MRYRQACSLLAATALLASVTAATASRTQVSPVVRTSAVGRAPLALAVDGRTRRVFVANFGSATVSMLDADSGAVLATTAVVPYPDTLAIATTPGRVFVASSVTPPAPAGRVDVLDAGTGHLVRTVAVGQGSHAFAVDERTGHVFVTNSMDRSVSMVEARSGRALRTTVVDLDPWSIAVDQHVDRVVVSMGEGLWPSATPGWVQVLDGRTGQFLRTVAVGLGPVALAVDERTGHVFVANSYGTLASPGGMSRLVAWGRSWLPAWGQQWLARLALPSHSSRVVAGSVSVLDVAR